LEIFNDEILIFEIDYSADIKNISAVANSTEQKLKMFGKNDSVYIEEKFFEN